MRRILFLLFFNIFFGQEIQSLQIISKYEMNMNWLSPILPDSSFFVYDSFNYAGFADIATDCYDEGIDYFEPPPLVDEWCRFTFPHSDIGINQCWFNELGLDLFTQDIRGLDENLLQTDGLFWDIEFSASLPGFASIYIDSNNIIYPCEINIELNGETNEFGIGDTLQFWYYNFASPPTNLSLYIGDCLIFGNVNLDNEINVIDILLMIDMIMGLEFQENQFQYADIDQNGIVNVNDVVIVVQLIMEE